MPSPKGKKLAMLGAGAASGFFSTASVTPVRVDGDLWAFNAGNGGGEAVLQDVRTGLRRNCLTVRTTTRRVGGVLSGHHRSEGSHAHEEEQDEDEDQAKGP